jgi:hypothetical protein
MLEIGEFEFTSAEYLNGNANRFVIQFITHNTKSLTEWTERWSRNENVYVVTILVDDPLVNQVLQWQEEGHSIWLVHE